MEKSKIELIKEWIETCPQLDGGKINVDYLKDRPQSYSIDRTPVQPEVKSFTDGGAIMQIAFDFTVTAPISSQAIVNLSNSKFCEDFQKWIKQQNRNGILPEIKGIQEVKCTSPRLYITKNRNNGNLYYSNELPILRRLILKGGIFMDEELKFYKRSDVVNFMGLTANATEFIRMKGFTSVPDSTNVETDETKYVDEKNKRKRTTGYATEKSYEADRIVGNKIHDMLAEVQELEQTDVNVPIVTVDFNKEGTTSGTYYARKRLYSVIPDSAGDDENKYTISGTLGANGEIEEGEATSEDNWKTCTFQVKSASGQNAQPTSAKSTSASK